MTWGEAIGNSLMGMWMAVGLFYVVTGKLPPPFDNLFGG